MSAAQMCPSELSAAVAVRSELARLILTWDFWLEGKTLNFCWLSPKIGFEITRRMEGKTIFLFFRGG